MTRTLAVLLVSSALLAPTFASAQTPPPPYRNKGQCEAALKQMRNEERAASPLNAGVFNRTFRAEDGRACTPVTDGDGNVIGYEITGGPGV